MFSEENFEVEQEDNPTRRKTSKRKWYVFMILHFPKRRQWYYLDNYYHIYVNLFIGNIAYKRMTKIIFKFGSKEIFYLSPQEKGINFCKYLSKRLERS